MLSPWTFILSAFSHLMYVVVLGGDHYADEVLRKVTLLMVHLLGPEKTIMSF